MHAAEHLILHGKLPITPQLSFNAQASLRVIRRLDVRGQTPYAWRSRRTCSAKWVREGGMANDELPGMYSVQENAAFYRCLRQAIVEDSSSSAQNRFLVARGKGQCQARRKVVVTIHLCLPVVTHAHHQSDVWIDFHLVLKEAVRLVAAKRDSRLPLNHLEQDGLARGKTREVGEHECASEVRGIREIEKPRAKTSPKAKAVRTARIGSDILKLQSRLLIGLSGLGRAPSECAFHLNCWAIRRIAKAFVSPLKGETQDIEEPWRGKGGIRQLKLVTAVIAARTLFGKAQPAYTFVARELVTETVKEGKGIETFRLQIDAAEQVGVVVGSGHVCKEETGRRKSIHNCGLIAAQARPAQEETAL